MNVSELYRAFYVFNMNRHKDISPDAMRRIEGALVAACRQVVIEAAESCDICNGTGVDYLGRPCRIHGHG